MAKYHYRDDEDLIESELLPDIRNMPSRRANRNPIGKGKQKSDLSKLQPAPPSDRENDFNFTYLASRHERQWIVNSLGGFYDQHWLDDVLRLVQGGKEAHVYLCRANPSVPGLDQPFLAAKVYRPRMFRNLKNDHIYRQGRQHIDGDGRIIREDGMLKSIALRTTWGLELLHTSWIEHEVKAMRDLHQAGADVPLCLASGNNAVLMAYIGDEFTPAPQLNTLELEATEARLLYQRVLHNIEIMLANGYVHGDLSAYNILYWQGEIYLIDFPQVIDPHSNKDAFPIFKRDVTRISEYFSRQGLRIDAERSALCLWTRCGLRVSPEIHPSLLNPDDRLDRMYWKKTARKT